MHQLLRDSIDRIRTSTSELSAQIIVVFILPIVLIITRVLPIEHRVLILTVIVALLLTILVAEKWSLSMLGFTKHIPLRAIGAYALFTTVGVWVISETGEQIGTPFTGIWWHYQHFLYLFFIVSALQEIAYRSYLIPALMRIEHSRVAVILTNAALFTFLHAIFPNILINLPLAFIGGICFAYIYIRYPYTILTIISHAVLNFAAVWFGFFTIH